MSSSKLNINPFSPEEKIHPPRLHWWYKPDNQEPQPKANILENRHSFIIELAIPGFGKKDLSIQIKGNSLIVAGYRVNSNTAKDNEYVLREFDYESFSRSFSLLEPIDPTRIEVRFKDGILRVNLPKGENDLEEFIPDLSLI